MTNEDRNVAAWLGVTFCIAVLSAVLGYQFCEVSHRAARSETLTSAEALAPADPPICVSLDGARAWRALPWQDEEPYRRAARDEATIGLLTLECNATGTVRRDRVEPGTTYVRLRAWRPLLEEERRRRPDAR